MLRRVVGGVGRTFIGAGVLLLLFIVYQLWGTNLAEANHQNSLAQQFKHEPAAPSGPLLPGYAIAEIQIRKIGIQKYVVQGTGEEDLQKGPGHYDGSPMPGQAGNVAIAGHRTTYGAPFYNLDRLQAGDDIDLLMPGGHTYSYSVLAQRVVDPSDVSVVQPKPPGIAPTGPNAGYLLTLTTCTPRFSAAQRLVVFAELTGTPAPPSGAPVSGPTPGAVLPGDTSQGAASPSKTSAPSNLTSGTTRAVPDTIGWGLAAVVMAVLAWLAARTWKRRRGQGRGLPAYVLGAAPFLIVLYFFFENITRLLPPSV